MQTEQPHLHTIEDLQTVQHVAIIPAYNESRFISRVVNKARQHVDRVIVVDDGSTDRTMQEAQSAGATVLSLPNNIGKAAAVEAGLQFVAQWQPECVVLLDGDDQHDAHEIPLLLAPIVAQEADLVVGSRFAGIKSDIPKWRQVGQHTLTWLTNLGSGVRCSDSQSGFRAFSAEILPLLTFSTSGFALESEMQFITRQHNLRLVEVPISVSYNGPSKRSPFIHALQVINSIVCLVGVGRPLFFWSTLSTITLLGCFLAALQVVTTYQQTAMLPIEYVLICALLLIIGVSMISTGIILHSLRAWLVEKGRNA